MKIDLTKMPTGQSGKVVSIEGGRGLSQRLENLGIVVGKRVTKLSAHFWQGPVTLKVDRTRLALGFGMASKVIVEVEE